MNAKLAQNRLELTAVATAKPRLARRASRSTVVQALPQPGGADILRAKKQLKQK